MKFEVGDLVQVEGPEKGSFSLPRDRRVLPRPGDPDAEVEMIREIKTFEYPIYRAGNLVAGRRGLIVDVKPSSSYKYFSEKYPERKRFPKIEQWSYLVEFAGKPDKIVWMGPEYLTKID